MHNYRAYDDVEIGYPDKLQWHPAAKASGTVDRSALPSDLPVRDGADADLDLVTAVDVPLRGSSRADDVAAVLADGGRLTASDRAGRRGFVVTREGNPSMLGADDVPTAQALLWQALAQSESGAERDCCCWTASQGGRSALRWPPG